MKTRYLWQRLIFLWPVVILLLTGCGSAEPIVTPPPTIVVTPSPTPSLPIDDRIRDSYRHADPVLRRSSVLRVTESYLRYVTVNDINDEDASVHYTNVAFSSERLTFSDPAFIRRRNDLAVVVLPDGMGMYLYDLSAGPEIAPVELSAWTVGLAAMEVTWNREELGISYVTIGQDDFTRLHFVLAKMIQENWHVAWLSDEEPDWWFNVYDATISVDDNLSRLVVIGKAFDTTDIFYEGEGAQPYLYREFRVEWLRDPETDVFSMSPMPGQYQSRQVWLWDIAEPSAYAMLVEFLERVRIRTTTPDDLLPMVANLDVITAANDFGLYLPERHYLMMIYNDELFVFRDRRGTFVVSVVRFEESPYGWMIESIKPLGADGGLPRPTPTLEPGQ